jgi:hypothetical protein
MATGTHRWPGGAHPVQNQRNNGKLNKKNLSIIHQLIKRIKRRVSKGQMQNQTYQLQPLNFRTPPRIMVEPFTKHQKGTPQRKQNTRCHQKKGSCNHRPNLDLLKKQQATGDYDLDNNFHLHHKSTCLFGYKTIHNQNKISFSDMIADRGFNNNQNWKGREAISSAWITNIARGDAGALQHEGEWWGRGRGSLSVWFLGLLFVREEAGLGEPGLAKLRSAGAISCPSRARAEAGQVEGRRAR